MPEMQEQLRAAVLQNRRAFSYAHDRRNNGISGGRRYDKLLIPANTNVMATDGLSMRRVQVTCPRIPGVDILPVQRRLLPPWWQTRRRKYCLPAVSRSSRAM